MGAKGVTVSELSDVGEALDTACCDAQKQGKTTILEVKCTRERGAPKAATP